MAVPTSGEGEKSSAMSSRRGSHISLQLKAKLKQEITKKRNELKKKVFEVTHQLETTGQFKLTILAHDFTYKRFMINLVNFFTCKRFKS